MKNSQSNKNLSGGVDKQVTFREKEWYKDKIVEMVKEIEDKKFLNQIFIILRNHIKKRGV